jgi:hypothetical protein
MVAERLDLVIMLAVPCDGYDAGRIGQLDTGVKLAG